MLNPMTGAAELYWENLAALEEARSQLVKFFETIWQEAWEQISVRSGESAGRSPRNDLEFYKGNESRAGHWWIYPPTPRVKMNVVVNDPRRSEHPDAYSVELFCAQDTKRSLERKYSGALGVMSEMAKEAELTLDWKRPKELLAKTIAIKSKDPSETVDGIVSTVRNYLLLLEKMDSWIQAQDERSPLNQT